MAGLLDSGFVRKRAGDLHFSFIATFFTFTDLLFNDACHGYLLWTLDGEQHKKKPDTLSDGIILIPDLQDVSIKIVEY